MASFLQWCLVLGAATPLASFAWIMLRGLPLRAVEAATRRSDPPAAGEPLAGRIATAAIGIALLLAVAVLVVWAGADIESRAAWSRQAIDSASVWLTLGATPVRLGVKLDSLSIIVYLTVTICASCVHVYSMAYMQRDAGYARYFAFLSLFCAAMLGLVIASDLLVLFVFWELVGICSYFLIGHWNTNPAANRAALRAFLVNRIGDCGFLIGLGLCAAYLGTLSLDLAPAAFAAGAQARGAEATAFTAAALFDSRFLGVSLATWLGIALFCGAIGKSAQFPLHIWLPDAMEGPTPVSALIHAATMVAAGVYLVARVFPLLTAEAQLFIAVIGCITLTIGALLALVQTDIKRVLAYSTVSQLGYMVFALGIGAWTAALFHLLTHAFFKALLFLGAGQVIAACRHEQDMRRLGGLWRSMPRTSVTFLIAVLAISGAGIPWTALGLGAFFSKDEILGVALARVMDVAESLPALLVIPPLLVAYLTPLYMGRCFMLTFMGRPRGPAGSAHPRESPLMTAPLLLLAGLTIVSGWFLFRALVAQSAPGAPPLAQTWDAADPRVLAVHGWLGLLVGFAWIAGLGGAYWLYARDGALLERLRRYTRPLRIVLENRFYIDRLYDVVIGVGARTLAGVCAAIDTYVIDSVAHGLAVTVERVARFAGVVVDARGVDGAANAVGSAGWRLGGALGRVQTGLLRNYLLLTLIGVVGLLIVAYAGGGVDWALLVVLGCGAAVIAPWRRIRITD